MASNVIGGFPPDLLELEHGGTPEKWTAGYWFDGKIDEDDRSVVRKWVDIARIVSSTNGNDWVFIGLTGSMDEVVQESAEAMRPVVSRISSTILRALMVPEEAVGRTIAGDQGPLLYDVTMTTFDILGLKR